ncbi:hypothetical protein GUITHDRAFT_102800 [Guillardia theta CCMP2712]|uniref:Uncharacterized protein n=1 Tax=Guillardia theta (strain CCMP2712) TaxID=905079 RepID=L1JSW6_GUITC|nr:hypothetical protein GUITHDRAFT_102800 [Guillardia theta CCMP2712]EKX51537.1 hypothetical protein GUITHDRAFT_102800 [Guillardia theta CCMP2712]|eukprot:XP_005838517.1 hypothetical protein GUITHDRAFT_102800 [Guillardia theta CCMP2712]
MASFGILKRADVRLLHSPHLAPILLAQEELAKGFEVIFVTCETSAITPSCEAQNMQRFLNSISVTVRFCMDQEIRVPLADNALFVFFVQSEAAAEIYQSRFSGRNPDRQLLVTDPAIWDAFPQLMDYMSITVGRGFARMFLESLGAKLAALLHDRRVDARAAPELEASKESELTVEEAVT